MKNKLPPGVDELRERLHDYMLGFAQHQSSGIAPLLGPDWQMAAVTEQRRRATRLIEAFDDELLASIASGAVRPAAEASYLKFRLCESEAEECAGLPVPSVEPAAAALSPPATILAMREAVEALALKHFGITTLETRKRDSLDFYSVAVWSVQEALSDAFAAGVGVSFDSSRGEAPPRNSRPAR